MLLTGIQVINKIMNYLYIMKKLVTLVFAIVLIGCNKEKLEPVIFYYPIDPVYIDSSALPAVQTPAPANTQ